MFNRMPLKVTSDSQDHPHIPTCHFDNSSRASTHLLVHAVANLFSNSLHIFFRGIFPNSQLVSGTFKNSLHLQ